MFRMMIAAVGVEHATLNRDTFARVSLGEVRAIQAGKTNAEKRTHGLRRCGIAGHLNAPWAWRCARAERYQTGIPARDRALCSASRTKRSCDGAPLHRERCERWDRIRAADRRENTFA